MESPLQESHAPVVRKRGKKVSEEGSKIDSAAQKNKNIFSLFAKKILENRDSKLTEAFAQSGTENHTKRKVWAHEWESQGTKLGACYG